MDTSSTDRWGATTDIDYAAIGGKYEPNKMTEDIAEADPELENLLFGGQSSGAGDSLAALELDVTVEGPDKITPIRTFSEANLHPVVLENITKCGYNATTAIQAYSIPAILNGQDVVAVAQTGSGKTAAYLAPIISQMMGKVEHIGGPRADTRAADYNPYINKVRAEPLVVIVSPTRELAFQIHEETRRLSYRSKLRTVCCYGGTPVKANLQQLGKGCDILIASPGRSMDLITHSDAISLERVRFTVIDEADKMLVDDDFETVVSTITSGAGTNENADHHYMMFSATFPRAAREIARQYLQEDYIRIRVGRAGSSHSNVVQQIIWADKDAKEQAVIDYLNCIEPALTIIFCNSTNRVELLDSALFNMGFPTVFMHSKRSQPEREDAIRLFNLKRTKILITSALCARGIDFRDVQTVINYDLPSTEWGGITEYVHRIGRTGRMGHRGKAVSFYNEDENSGIAQDLVNNLVECDQEVPDFLSGLVPQKGQLKFEDDSDADADADADAGEDAGEEMAKSGGDGNGDSDFDVGSGADDVGAGW